MTATPKVPLGLLWVPPFILNIFTGVGITGYIFLYNGQTATKEIVKLYHEARRQIDNHPHSYLTNRSLSITY